MNCGSPFFAEMSRTMSSDRPRGTVSSSISVTKPYLYFCSVSCSWSCSAVVMGVHSQGDGRGPSVGGRGTGAMAESGRFWSAPWMARVTGSQLALAAQVASMPQAIFAGDALGERDGPLERLDDLGDRDRSAGAGQPVPAVTSAVRDDEPRLRELLAELRDGREGHAASGGQLLRGERAVAPREVREEDDRVVGELRHPDHPVPPGSLAARFQHHGPNGPFSRV